MGHEIATPRQIGARNDTPVGARIPGIHTNQAHSMAEEADFLKTRVIALYYALIDMATRV